MIKNILQALIISLFFNIAVIPQAKISKPLKANDNATYTKLNINNISTYYYNNGDTDLNPSDNSGFEFPKNSGRTAIFESGFVWGTKIAGDTIPRVCGSTYGSGLQPGIIKADGTASDPSSPKYRIYRVRPDVYPGGPQVDLSAEAKEEGTTEQQLRAQYEGDWTQWPADIGAPYVDKNNNGKYDPAVDIPGVNGAGQTVWYVTNDLDSVKAKKLYGTSSIGMEMQVTAWAYNREGALGNTEFRKYKLINKSKPAISNTGITYDSMYVSYWSDAELGYVGDDYLGTDTANNFLYVYNGNDIDIDYSPLPPPAIAYNLIQGPMVDSPGSTAMFDGRIIQDKKNLKITASTAFDVGDPNLSSPAMGYNPLGSVEFYRFMQGLSFFGDPKIDPVSKKKTTFYAPGDPVNKSGWFEGMYPPGDRRGIISSGPFYMAPGDTQEVVYAITAAGGTDRFNSIKLLRYYNDVIATFYRNGLNVSPKLPVVKADINYDLNGINLDWGNDPALKVTIENFNKDGYSFQGYNVYQLPYPEFNFRQDGVRLATFDKIDGIENIQGSVMDENSGYAKTGVLQFGSDSGIQRSLRVTRDSVTGNHLINGKRYYFAITGYYYNPNNSTAAIESLLKVVSTVYREDAPGLKYNDSLNVIHSAGQSDFNNIVYAAVYDPQKMNSKKYSIVIGRDSIKYSSNYYYSFLVWDLIDSTNNKILINKQNNIQGAIFELPDEGIRVGVNIPSNALIDYHKYFSSYDQTVKSKPNTNPLRLVDIRIFGGSDGTARAYNQFPGGGNSVTDEDLKQDLLFRFSGIRESGVSTPEDTIIVSGGSIATLVNKDMTISKRVRIPFELWEIDNNRQINVAIYSRNADSKDPWGNSGTPLYYRSEGRSYIVPVATTYNESASVNDVSLTSQKATWGLFFDNTGSFSVSLGIRGWMKSHWDTGDELVVHYTAPVSAGDVYSFTTPAFKPGTGQEFIPGEYKLYQNYPNPFNPSTSIRYNVPKKGFVKINIYNILGQLVKSLVNKEVNKGLYQADFNASLLASGIYIYTMNVDGNFYYAKKMILMK